MSGEGLDTALARRLLAEGALSFELLRGALDEVRQARASSVSREVSLAIRLVERRLVAP